MKHTRSILPRATTSAALLYLLAAEATAVPQYDFLLVDSFNSNPLAGEAYLWDISDGGVACGMATADNVIGYPGFVWDQSSGKTRIPVSNPLGICAAGLVVGNQSVYDLSTALAYSPPNLGPGTYAGPSFGGVNDAGVAVGMISTCSCSDSGGVLKMPYIWDAAGGARTIFVPNAKGLTRINNAGVAIGWLNGFVLNEAFFVNVWTGSYTLLSEVFPSNIGVGIVRASDINDNGQVVGTRAGSSPVAMYGYVFDPGRGVRLLPFPGSGYQQSVRPFGINNAGVIVGEISTVLASARAFVYSESDGLRDLNSAALVAAIPAGYVLSSAQKVNTAGWIVGNGRTAAGKNTGFVLKPRAPACTADINADGVVDGADFVGFVNSFSVGDASVDGRADINGDAVVDGSDFIAFINAFSAGC